MGIPSTSVTPGSPGVERAAMNQDGGAAESDDDVVAMAAANQIPLLACHPGTGLGGRKRACARYPTPG